jgi:hypothetical protein
MKHFARIITGMLLAASLHAAAPAATDAEPAVDTSAPVQQPGTARGNPRRQEVTVGPAAPAADAAPGESAPAAPARPTDQPRRGDADRIELSTTQITGNAELPRVMYVVPWKRAELGDLAGKPAKSLLDEVLAPVDRDVFRRQNRYYEALKPDAAPKDQ